MKTTGRLLFGICFLMCGYLSIPFIWLHIVAPNGMMFFVGFIVWTLGWHRVEHKVVFPWVGTLSSENMKIVGGVSAAAMITISILMTISLIKMGAWIISIPFMLLVIFGAYFLYLENAKVQISSSITIKEEK